MLGEDRDLSDARYSGEQTKKFEQQGESEFAKHVAHPCSSRLDWFQKLHFIGSLAERTNDDIAVFRLNKDLAKDVNRNVPDEERVVVIGAGGMETRYCSAFWTRHAKGSPEKIVAP